MSKICLFILFLLFITLHGFSCHPDFSYQTCLSNNLPTKNNINYLLLKTYCKKSGGVSSLQCSILEISRKKAITIAPPRVSTEQWTAYWGMNPTERLQKVMESVLFAYGGAWLAWFTSFMAGQLVASVIGTATIFNWMYNPWIYAKKRNAKLWPGARKLRYGIFTARIKSLTRIKRKAANTIGMVSPEFLEMVLEDELGRRLDVLTQWQESYRQLREEMSCECLISAPSADFRQIVMVSEVWVPAPDVWVGDYPYLEKPAFRSLIRQKEGGAVGQTPEGAAVGTTKSGSIPPRSKIPSRDISKEAKANGADVEEEESFWKVEREKRSTRG